METHAKAKDLTRWLSTTQTHTELKNAVLDMLALHQKVAFAWNANTGQANFGKRSVRFGFVGQADILGMLVQGRFLAIECKTGRGEPTKAQLRFVSNVRTFGGLAGVVRSVDEAKLMLDMAHPGTHVANHRPKA